MKPYNNENKSLYGAYYVSVTKCFMWINSFNPSNSVK